jgi:hypothetical protein
MGPDGLQHLEPAGPPQAFKTYSYHVKHRKATCAEVECEAYLHGWRTMLSAIPMRDRETINKLYSVKVVEDDIGEKWAEFAPGQVCFIGMQPFPYCHTLPWEGHERFAERNGDWRARVGDPYVHARPDDWVDSFANHQIRIEERLNRG